MRAHGIYEDLKAGIRKAMELLIFGAPQYSR